MSELHKGKPSKGHFLSPKDLGNSMTYKQHNIPQCKESGTCPTERLVICASRKLKQATLPLPSSPPVCPNDVTSALYMC